MVKIPFNKVAGNGVEQQLTTDCIKEQVTVEYSGVFSSILLSSHLIIFQFASDPILHTSRDGMRSIAYASSTMDGVFMTNLLISTTGCVVIRIASNLDHSYFGLHSTM
ncbi:hypothetical protein TNCV_3885951 [Trichonephila clavipes]|nr:hypothetical protein TNCV_3885951 [Trichonephila clavipes]